MYNERDEIIVELLRRTSYRLVDLREATRGVIKSEYSLLHRLALLEASGRISSERHPEHKETIYTLSEAEKENTDAQTSANNAQETTHEQFST